MSASRNAVFFVVGLICLGGLAAACGDDDASDNTSSSSGGSSGSSGSTSGSSGTSSGTSGTSGGTSGGTSSSGDAGNEAGSSSGGTIENGEACTTVSTESTECKSGICSQQGSGGGGGGGGGGTPGKFCTIACTMPNADDPVCENAGVTKFTGRCRGQRVCAVE